MTTRDSDVHDAAADHSASSDSRQLDWHVELTGVSKRFGGAHALRDVDLRIARGTVHCLVGENGAGKSTIGKIIAGVYTADSGELLVKGESVRYHAPHEALQHGSTMIAQELALLPTRTVSENVFLGIEPSWGPVLRTRELKRRYRELTQATGFSLAPGVVVGSLKPGQQMEVEILRSLARNVDLIVMDEPTAALTSEEAEKLFGVIRSLRDKGTTIVYVSHRLTEVLELADSVSIFKEGRHIRTTRGHRAETEASLISGMLGRSLETIFPPKRFPDAAAPVVLEASGLVNRPLVKNVDLHIRAGEIVGLAGLVGAGRSETARLLFGADRLQTGEIRLNGEAIRLRTPKDAIRKGIVMLPESRKTQGLFMGMSVRDNSTVSELGSVSSGGVLSGRKERAQTQELIDRFDVRTASQRLAVGSLSGGNQQKVALGKWLLGNPAVVIVDEPTHGVDIGAKAKIYEILADLAAQGCAVLVISSEMTEVLGLAHRILVMADGHLVAELGPDATEDDVLDAAFTNTRMLPQKEAS